MDGLAKGVELFLEYLARDRSSATNTLAAYHNDLSQFEGFVRGRADSSGDGAGLESLGLEALTAFVFFLREKGYSQATVARKIAAVKSFFKYAHKAGLVPRNPALSVGSPRVSRSAPRGLRTGDVRVLLEVGCAGEGPEAIRDRAMLTLLYHSGMRVSEMVALDVEDIDLAQGSVRCRGRAGRVRSLPLSTEARKVLEEYLSQGRPLLERAHSGRALVLNQRGARLTRQGFWLILKTRARGADLQGPVSPYTLRHAFAFDKLDHGTALRELQELLGHVNLASTQVYALGTRGQRR